MQSRRQKVTKADNRVQKYFGADSASTSVYNIFWSKTGRNEISRREYNAFSDKTDFEREFEKGNLSSKDVQTNKGFLARSTNLGKIHMRVLRFLKQHYLLFLITVFYFLVRTAHLTAIPIFNDEAIYLDWGWRETHEPGYLYYSLYDAKQPFLMWFFGIAQSLLGDPLFAGRLVSVLIGYITMLGIYFVSRRFFGQNVAFLAGILYIITPLFSFFDRQALMESSMTALSIWSFYLLFLLWQTSMRKHAVLLGGVLGMGFFIKSAALIFVVIVLLLYGYRWFREPRTRKGLLQQIGIIFSVFLLVNILLLIQPQFWSTFHANSRYSLTVSELIHFPVSTWFRNVAANLLIAFFYISPLLFLSAVGGFFILFKLKTKQIRLYFAWFAIGILLQSFFSRFASQRYTVSFLPLLVPAAAFFIYGVVRRMKVKGAAISLFVIISACFVTILQVFYPVEYFYLGSRYTAYPETQYINGFTSGYGVVDAVNYLKSEAKGEKIIVAVAENSGNPESAMHVYFNKFKNVPVAYLDANRYPEVNQYDCLYIHAPTYFVSRDEQLAGLEKFFLKLKTIKNPYGTNRIGIYKLKDPCTGKTLKLQIIKT